MSKEFSIYDAKAKLSALVREVRESGRSFVITVHGKPAAELRPVDRNTPRQTIAERIADLTTRGIITPAAMQPADPRAFPIGEPAPGALQRFLDDRE